MNFSNGTVSVLKGISDALIITDTEGCILFVNPAAEEMTGFSQKESLGKDLKVVFLLSGNDLTSKELILNLSIANPALVKAEYGILTDRSGNVKQIEFNFGKLLDESNNFSGVIITFRDIPEKIRRRLEEKSKLEFAIQHSGEVIFMTDIKGIINYANPMFMEFYGFSRQEVIGATPAIIKSGFMSCEFYSQFWHEILSGKSNNYEIVNRTKSENFVTIQQSASPIFDIDNKISGFISIQRDITEKKQNEDLLRRALDKAEESDKLKTAFLNQMSHEIRTPLNSILGFMSLMEEELINKGITDLALYFDSVNRSSLRLQRTIEDILAMSSIQIGNYYTSATKLNLRSIIELLLNDYRSLAQEKNIEIVFSLKIDLPVIYGDSYTVIQSFQHLIDNAFKFTSKGKVTITVYGNDDSISVDVEDTGIGISKEYMDNLFKPFSQEDIGYNRRYDGNGLGLAITKEYLRLNHANISVKSEKGIGTIFTVTFYHLLEDDKFDNQPE
ncbi:MAG: PAS domain-containing sensor histidine kinase [Bacteroidota bacterium]|nr:PAS domain-containing sensor histidine kinase [Bacteroidota bacterium]MDP4191326.1 PAS domain-containing sensor histidine kinase [Bacteroidota bacterium]MDP4195805.1 PAS domain-containing sensor histidine kinase [Bacteroidota bacterium]